MAKGYFVGANGNRYSVEFIGDGVADITLSIVGVTIAMEANDRKFTGFKTTTAKVMLAVDEPMLWLYTESSFGILVTIFDETQSDVVFAGYVVPFTFEQPHTGSVDVISVDCVDAATAAKDELYRSANDDTLYGVDEKAEVIVSELRSLAGRNKVIKKVVYHTNFGDNTEGKTFDAKVAQAGFLQDKMTALDALSAACMFFGYTSALVGDTLYLYDEHCLIHAANGKKRRALKVDLATREEVRYQEEGSPLRVVDISAHGIHNDITLSVEQSYDAIQITPKGSDTAVLLPDVCSDENIGVCTDGRGQYGLWINRDENDDPFREYRIPRTSKVMELGLSSGEDWANDLVLGGTGWTDGAMLMNVTHYPIVDTDPFLLGSPSTKNVLWVRANCRKTAFSERCGFQLYSYSHTGGLVQLDLQWGFATADGVSVEDLTEAGGLTYIRVVNVKIGDEYITNPYGFSSWDDYSELAKGIVYKSDGTILPTAYSADIMRSGLVYPMAGKSGQVSVEIAWDIFPMDPVNGYKGDGRGIFITKLGLVGYGDPIWTGHRHFRYEYVSEPKNVLEVDTVLTTRDSWQEENPNVASMPIPVNARPSIVPDRYYPCGGYMGDGEAEKIGGSGILMEQLKSRYGVPRPRYTMTVRTADILPSDTILFLGKEYTVEGYEKDLVNSTTRIIID